MSERRRRGVRLTDLDRTKHYVIAHTGRRWETLADLEDFLDAIVALQLEADSAADEVPSTSVAPGRHAATGDIGSPIGA